MTQKAPADTVPVSNPNSQMIPVPTRSEAAEYYFTYIDKVPRGDIRRLLREQAVETQALLRGLSDDQSRYRYAAGKWSLRQVLSHINDAERVFSFRAFWFARGFDTPLPSFDQDEGVSFALADDRPWSSHVDELTAIRAATVALFDGLPDDAWDRRGVASGSAVSVRALAYICAGHVAHHLGVIETHYLKGL
jgi:hypothetical protein